MQDGNYQPCGDRFPPTRRSVIEAVASIDAEERARESLCAAYRRPIYKYIRLGWSPPADEAQHLTQGFFVEALDRELLEKFDAKKSPPANLSARVRGQLRFEPRQSQSPPETRRKHPACGSGFCGC
jgi:hypothetical protein